MATPGPTLHLKCGHLYPSGSSSEVDMESLLQTKSFCSVCTNELSLQHKAFRSFTYQLAITLKASEYEQFDAAELYDIARDELFKSFRQDSQEAAAEDGGVTSSTEALDTLKLRMGLVTKLRERLLKEVQDVYGQNLAPRGHGKLRVFVRLVYLIFDAFLHRILSKDTWLSDENAMMGVIDGHMHRMVTHANVNVIDEDHWDEIGQRFVFWVDDMMD
ncbi:hypothetical protein BKA67DRAFT_659117 [Truncatella angustata]|uniref:Uncharacterized protein n=1 Tax=Truncatella angustata TaxID=152316 RepID=A0A9P8UMD5_9PEZI|nr:uncharacterized protein BKA67DRAFT_659117 [Truncatella angustata]KAH6654854.1 hypothetical protein BKA67DRAFT_659117 [Truncatella angustata]